MNLNYSGRFNVKYIIQARQFRKDHEDSHYAAAVFRCQRELAVMFRQHSTFHCVDDKHNVKVSEPYYPVAAAERGKRCLCGATRLLRLQTMIFAKFSIIPSVVLSVDIPEDVFEP